MFTDTNGPNLPFIGRGEKVRKQPKAILRQTPCLHPFCTPFRTWNRPISLLSSKPFQPPIIQPLAPSQRRRSGRSYSSRKASGHPTSENSCKISISIARRAGFSKMPLWSAMSACRPLNPASSKFRFRCIGRSSRCPLRAGSGHQTRFAQRSAVGRSCRSLEAETTLTSRCALFLGHLQ